MVPNLRGPTVPTRRRRASGQEIEQQKSGAKRNGRHGSSTDSRLRRGPGGGGSLTRLAGARIRAWPILVVAVLIEACLGATSGLLRPVLAVTACLGVVGWCAANTGHGRRSRTGSA